MKRGIIFDMDGTLWDSAENVARSWSDAVEKSGLLQKKITTEDIKGVMGKTMDVIANVLFPELQKQQRDDLLELCCEAENAYLRENGGILYDGVEKTLAVLKERGYHLYIVSNCQKGYIEAFLDYYHLWDYIDDLECYGNNLLPKWDNIRLVKDRNHLDEAVYVGDIEGDYEASCKAGVEFIHAAYGFGRISAKVPKIHSFTELAVMDMDAVYTKRQ